MTWDFVVPLNWTEEQDILQLLQEQGIPPLLLEKQIDYVRITYGDLNTLVNRSLAYFEPNRLPLEPETLLGKISAIEDHVAAKAPSEHYRKRLMEALALCRFAVMECQRIIPQYGDESKRGWLTPLIHLDTRVSIARSDLQEAMVCEHDGFKRRSITFKEFGRRNRQDGSELEQA